MNTLWQRLGSEDEQIAKAAYKELEQAADGFGLTAKSLYDRMAETVLKHEAAIKEQIAKGERHSAVDFSDTFMPVAKAEAKRTVDADDDDSKAAAKDADEDEMYDSKRPSKSVPGHRDVVTRGVSFKSVVFDSSREYPIEDQPQARQPRGADTTQDGLNRSYGSEVAARIAGGFSGVTENEDSQIPVAGSGPTWTGLPGDENHGFAPMPSGEGDAGRVGGENRGSGRVPPGGKDGAYELEVEGGTPGSGVVRVGPNFVLPGLGGSEASTPLFVAPSPATSVAKSEFEGARRNLKKGTFRSVIKGPEGGPSDGQSNPA